ncbi:conserved hypothetical protein [Gordonia bronchialis DSM 43247]|uniref:Polyketide cyclase/dehydrase n=1 Tax=Gordonia bronchialis (strain ATCC 25592 / DSM 43247 / BCRC 13721 / JCM 3198 / KCTC 3076 / NBRC 16047 / NCTC 10667) TaxID=526226 RepID=D0L9R5_GORB4|nr:hypothetical protein [Gordonia bronchialis]ACY22080.1 conserved hypothetical protein [Gordonia bronchialis DSM 43247]QGS24354.1 hypothetical protein FOB84_09440 [Gordonia bronchialis]UAK39347.1 hypothetical protein K8O93_06595 [Gordonia bronchialis]STQ64996.1 Uncharacterized conserved protein [Gordonia bronchialis]
MTLCRVVQTSVVHAQPDAVWDRVASMPGINAELMPYMRMVLPRRHRGKTVADIEVGVPVGKVWLLYGGFLPLDYDNLTIAELVPGSGFREESSMLAMAIWRHTRRLTTVDGGTEVSDTLEFRPRRVLRPATPLLEWFVGHLFRHRHRRLADHFR